MSDRLLLTLLAVLFVSAFAVVDVRTHYLLLFTHEQHLVVRHDALQVEWGRLLLEQGTLTEQQRVRRIARQRLDMTMPDPRGIVLLYTHAASVP
ncbi:MAG: cell division protein FtsL [Gammaproteobacteria bacterium]|nr:cell division protein FtsL [Gammaproteobacteria bacterium]